MNILESRANQLFADAIELGSAEEQTAFLDCECGDNQQLREAVEALLDSYKRVGSFLEQPAAELRPIHGSDRDIAELSNSAQSGMTHSVNDAGKSVLNSLGEHVQAVPQVLLRDAKGDVEPITFPASKEIPQTNAKYHLLGEIARGGIGAILKGRDTDLGRDLAVKVLLEQHKDSPEVIHRFIEEAQIGGQLQHPGIAPVYELGQFADSRPFFAMKLIKGETLAMLLAKREQPIDDRGKLLAIFEQISQTMAYAHSRGVIHRDLKPPNIMVGAFGEVQVMDWGLAKVLHTGGVADEKKAFAKQKDASVIQTSRSVGSDTPGDFGSETRMGSVLGTPAYMPPEQALGEIDNLDERSDVFGLGAILCEILTGLPPYVGEHSGEILRQATRGKLEDCFARLNKCEADEELVELTKRCLAHEPCDRPRDASELAEHVSSYLESVQTKLREAELERVSQTARVAEEQKRRRVSMALAASFILLLCVAGGSWAIVQHQTNERQLAATTIVTEALTKARVHQGLAANGELLEQLQEMEKASLLAGQAMDLAQKSEVDHALRTEARRMWESTKSTVELSSQKLDRLARDQDLKRALERIRVSKGANWKDANRDPRAVSNRYARAFRKAGIDLAKLSRDDAAELIRQSAIKEEIIVALDDWSTYRIHDPRGTSVVQGDLSVVRGDFETAVAMRNWSQASELGETIIAQDPNNALLWLKIAPVIAVVGHEEAYQDLCRRIVEQFSTTHDGYRAERACKACLLRPGSVDLRRLPTKQLNALIETQEKERGDNKHAPAKALAWSYGTKALLSYRTGDPSSTLQNLAKSWSLQPASETRVFNYSVAALAQHNLGRVDEAREELRKAHDVIQSLLKDESNAALQASDIPPAPLRHEVLIGQVLFREAAETITPRELPNLATIQSAGSSAINLRMKASELANRVDTNEWRCQLRSALQSYDIGKLQDLALNEDITAASPEMIAWLGSVLRESGKPALAIAVMQRKLAMHPNDFWLNCEMADTVDNRYGNKPEGIGYLRAAIAARPDNNATLYNLACRLRNAGSLAESKYYFLRLIDARPSDYWLRMDYALTLHKMRDHEGAVFQASLASELEPRHDWAHRRRADALMELGRIEAAVEAYRDAIAVNREYVTPNKATLALVNIEKDRRASYYLLLADALTAIDRVEEARDARRDALDLTVEAMDLDSENHNALNSIAWRLLTQPADDAGSYLHVDEAVQAAQAAANLKPNSGEILRTLGVALYRAEDWTAAISALQKSIDLLVSESADSRTNMLFIAMSHWQLERPVEARNWYGKAFELIDDPVPSVELGRFYNEAAALIRGSEKSVNSPMHDAAATAVE